MTNPLRALFTLVLALVLPTAAIAQTCDDQACVNLFESAGNIMGEVNSSDGTKHFGLTQLETDIPLHDRPILIGHFNSAGFGCFGGMSVPTTVAAVGGVTYSTAMTCSFQNSNGQTWRVTITITWVYNAEARKWEIADMRSEARLIKTGNQVQ